MSVRATPGRCARVVLAMSIVAACGSDADESGPAKTGAPTDAGAADAIVVTNDAGDPRCQTQPLGIGDHPWAVVQATVLGKDIRSVTGWRGQVYFGYGDLNGNSGPIDIASWEPASKSWIHRFGPVAAESIERYVPIGDQLWALNSDAHGSELTTPDYWTADANHEWSEHEFAPTIHLLGVTERVPGEVWLAGSSFLDPVTPAAPSGFLWRSVGGAPWEQMFPVGPNVEEGTGPFGSIAALGSILFADHAGSVWTWTNAETGFLHARRADDPMTPIVLGEFLYPVQLGQKIVFADFGNYLFSFDGKTTTPLGFRTFPNASQIGFYETPMPIFTQTEGRLIAVNETGDVVMSTDLATWKCIGKAPSDVRGIGSLDGVVYFGGANGHVYSYADKSW